MTRTTLGAAALLAAFGTAAAADHLDIMLEGATTAGNMVTVPGVEIDMPGFLVVHAVVDGQPVIPSSIGHTMIPAGTTMNVSVPIDSEFMAGSTYMLMLHYDTDGDGVYSFGEGMTDVDTPAMNAEGAPYTVMFQPTM